MCDNKGPTIIIMRLKGEALILGGYNPINWDKNKNGSWGKTSDSFIFNLDKEIILSRVQTYNNAIYQSTAGPNFCDLEFLNIFNANNGVYLL